MNRLHWARFAIAGACAAVAMSAGTSTGADDRTIDLDGTWDQTRAAANQAFTQYTVRVGCGKMTFAYRGGASATAYRVDLSKQPVWIDYLDADGKLVTKGIIAVQGDEMTMAWSGRGLRPVSFEDGRSVSVMHFVRDGSPTTRVATTEPATTPAMVPATTTP